MSVDKEIEIRVEDCPLYVDAVNARGERKRYVVLATKDGRGICVNGAEPKWKTSAEKK